MLFYKQMIFRYEEKVRIKEKYKPQMALILYVVYAMRARFKSNMTMRFLSAITKSEKSADALQWWRVIEKRYQKISFVEWDVLISMLQYIKRLGN